MSLNSSNQSSFYATSYVEWKGWKRLFQSSQEEDALFAAEMGSFTLRGQRVLEVGFGSGAFIEWAQRQGANITGCELIQELCDAGVERGFDTRQGGIDSFDLEIQQFDLIVAFDVMEHIPPEHLVGFLQSVRSLLLPNGVFVARMPNGSSPWGLINQYGDLTHVSVLTPGRLQQLADHSGLRLVECKDAARVRTQEGALKWGIRMLARKVLYRLVCTAFGWWQVPLDPNLVAWFAHQPTPTQSNSGRSD